MNSMVDLSIVTRGYINDIQILGKKTIDNLLQVQLLESEGVQFQPSGAASGASGSSVAAESFWRFPKDVDLKAGAKSSY